MLLCLALLALLILAAGEERFASEIVTVSDGDTRMVLQNGQAVRIRLMGIDCPDLLHSRTVAWARRFSPAPVICRVNVFGLSGLRLLWEAPGFRVPGEVVPPDGEVILLDGRSLDRELVRAGLAGGTALCQKGPRA